MGKFQEKLDNLLAAVTFAEAGETDTAREFLNNNKKVLFATRESRPDNQALKYAMNISRRIGASLDILCISSKEGIAPTIAKVMEDLTREGITCTLSKRIGCLRNQIIDYTTVNKGVQFVVIESSENLDVECRRTGKKMSDAWKHLSCPLVVVSELGKV
jgi:hypothetical protein